MCIIIIIIYIYEVIIITGYVYIITNKFNDKIYIGQTRRKLITRLRSHKHMSNNIEKCKYTKFLIDMHYNDISEYKIEAIHTIVDENLECLNNKLDRLEIESIYKYKHNGYNLYNIALGGKSGDNVHLMDKKDQDEINKKKSESLIKYHEVHVGCKRGDNNGMFGKNHTIEVKELLSTKAKSRIGIKSSNIKRYLCLENNTIYNGIKDIAIFLNVTLKYATYRRYRSCTNSNNKKEFKIVNYNNEEYTFILLEKVLSI